MRLLIALSLVQIQPGELTRHFFVKLGGFFYDWT